MTTTWDRNVVAERVASAAERYGCDNPQQRKQLEFSLLRTDPVEVFFGLLNVFAQTLPEEFAKHQLAGELLYLVKPKPQLTAYEILRAVLPTYEQSIEEIPWYLISEFGEEAFLAALDDLSNELSGRHKQECIRTMRFWSRRYRAKPASE